MIPKAKKNLVIRKFTDLSPEYQSAIAEACVKLGKPVPRYVHNDVEKAIRDWEMRKKAEEAGVILKPDEVRFIL